MSKIIGVTVGTPISPKKIENDIKPVKTVNNTAPGENGNVNIDVGVTKESDPTVPSWAKQPEKPTYTASEVGALPDTTEIPTKISELENDNEYVQLDDLSPYAKKTDIPSVPTKVSQLTNDSGFLTSVPGEYVTETELAAKKYLTSYTETDPTVPAWAKQTTKPAYTKSEVGLGNVDNVKQYSDNNPPPYPVTSVNGKTGDVSVDVPSKTSDLENNSGFITRTVTDLASYYLKSETLTKAEINALVSAIPKFAISVVSTLPTSNISSTTVYLLKSGTGSDLYTEYIYANGAWEILGSQRVDLTGYALKEEIPTKLSELDNDTGYITKAVSDLVNYYKKSEVYSRDEIDKKGFLTEHQDISGKLDASKLPEAINTALAQAKESGEFDGEDGKSAYEYAKDGGYTGTEAEFAEMLAGDVLPDYWKDAVDAAVNKVKALQDAGGNDVVNFVWFSDVHYGGDKTYVKNVGIISAAIMDKCDIPLALMCGDTLYAGANNLTSEDALLNLLEEAMDDIYAPIGFDRLMLISGNHEDAYGKYTAEDGTVAHYTNKADPKRIWNKLYRPQSTDFRRVFGGDGTYFWMDNVPQKVRFVCLNSSFYDGEPNPNGTTKAMSIGFGAEQLAWFENTALNVDDDWSVAVCVHIPPIASYASDFSGNDYTEVRRIITEATAKIIAVFTGHMHRDNIVTGDLPCPVVTVICAANTPYDGTEAERIAGTTTETAIDIVSINKAAKTINMTRLGHGSDRVVGYGGTEVVAYTITNTLTNCVTSNNATMVEEGSPYNATITANSGYVLDSVNVTMGGESVAVTDGTINIASVTGDIIITATATMVETAVTNLYDKSQARLNTRYSFSSSNFQVSNGTFATNWVELPANIAENEVYLYTKGLNLVSNNYGVMIGTDDVNATIDFEIHARYAQLNDTSGAYSMLGEVLDADSYYYKIRLGYNADGSLMNQYIKNTTHICLTYQVGTTAITVDDLPDFIMSFEPIE